MVFILAIGMMIGSFVFDKPVRWENYNFWKHSIALNDIDYYLAILQTTVILKIVSVVITFFDNMDNNSYVSLAEQEAEQNYQNDMDRYEHYWATKYEEAIRQANIDATVRGISNEELLGIYVRLAEINNQVNERNFALFNQARQALESRNTYSIDDALNQFRQKFLG